MSVGKEASEGEIPGWPCREEWLKGQMLGLHEYREALKTPAGPMHLLEEVCTACGGKEGKPVAATVG